MKRETENILLGRNISNKDWIGRVVDNDDPLRMFRCKIRVLGLFDDLEDEMIPWAFPANNLSFSSESNGGFGSGSTPKIGTILKVRFNNGDIYSGEYYSIQNINESLRKEISDDYENAHIFCYDEDENLKILYTQAQGLILSLNESIINIKPNNEILIEHNSGKGILIKENDIHIGNKQKGKAGVFEEPAVLGEKNVKALLELSGEIQKLCNALNTAANAMNSIVSSAPLLAPLLGVWTPLQVQANLIKSKLSGITDTSTIPETRSNTIFIDGPSIKRPK